jgi:hypothetical protein
MEAPPQRTTKTLVLVVRWGGNAILERIAGGK